MKFVDLVQFLETIAPFQFQEEYDNAGLIVGHPETEITEVLISLDATEEIVDEAIERGANLIVAHHPIVFKGLKRFNAIHYVERSIMKAIKHDIGIIAIHTNLDNVFHHGVNQRICERLGLSDLSILSAKPGIVWNGQEVGSGMLGTLDSPMKPMECLQFIKESMQTNVIKYTKIVHNEIQKIAVCGGSGGFLLESAKSQGAQLFISSDYKYHEFFEANGDIIIADIGHYESEQFTSQLLVELISQKFSTFAAHCTKLVTNPVKYL